MHHGDLPQKIVLKAYYALGVSYHDHDHTPFDVMHDVCQDAVQVGFVGRRKAFRIAFEKEFEIKESCLEGRPLHLLFAVVESAYIIAVVRDHVSQGSARHKSDLALVLACLCLGEHPAVGIHYQHDIVLLLGNILPDKDLLASGSRLPVDILDVVSGHVFTELIEIHTPALIDGVV